MLGGHRRVWAADGDVRTASIAELPLSDRDQRGRQQQRSPEVRRVVDGESHLLLADRRAPQRGSAGCRSLGSARHRRRRPHCRCSFAHERRRRGSHGGVLQRVRPGAAIVAGEQERDALSELQRCSPELHVREYSEVPEEHRAGARRRRAVVLRQRPDVRGLEARLLLRRQGARVRLRPGSAPREQRTRWHPGPGRHHCGPIPARPQLSNPTRRLHPGDPALHDSAAPSAGRQYHHRGRSDAHEPAITGDASHESAMRCMPRVVRSPGARAGAFRPDRKVSGHRKRADHRHHWIRAWHELRRCGAARRSAEARLAGAHLLDAQLLPQRERPRGR